MGDAKSKNVEIRLTRDRELPEVPLDPDRFSQALLNLYLNALEAMGAGGVLSIRSAPGEGDYIQVEISDTGCGIRPEDLPRIFDPYFTNKPGGTGLGLAIVHKIVEAHRGREKVESTVGEGTVFTLLLPVQCEETHPVRSE